MSLSPSNLPPLFFSLLKRPPSPSRPRFAMNHIHSSELPTPDKPPEFRPPRTFMAVALIPTALFHVVWMNGLSPPFDFLLFITTILLCFPLDYISIKIIWKSTKRVEEITFWWFCYCFQFGYVLVSADFLLYRWMDRSEVPRKMKIPVMVLLVVLSFFLFIGGLGGEFSFRLAEERSALPRFVRADHLGFLRFPGLCELNLRAGFHDQRTAGLEWQREGLLLREQAKERRKARRKENRARAKEAKVREEEEREEEEEDLRVCMCVPFSLFSSSTYSPSMLTSFLLPFHRSFQLLSLARSILTCQTDLRRVFSFFCLSLRSR